MHSLVFHHASKQHLPRVNFTRNPDLTYSYNFSNNKNNKKITMTINLYGEFTVSSTVISALNIQAHLTSVR